MEELKTFLPQIIATVVAVLLLWLSKMVTAKIVNKYGTLLQKSEIRRLQIRQVISILLNILFIIVIAFIWGVKTNNLWVAISSIIAILGVALFAQWSVLSNVTAGIIMFFGAPFRVGDEITIIDKDIPIEATIENIHTFYTHIRKSDGQLIVIPNNLFLQKIVSIKNQ
ncbi:MAG: mechanosensitive ion channel family protein [Alistipes sp.]|nr:mechanosensitive ion channel family protein [Alistipes sp.]MCD8172753.1 mechanosensitive ion channel family protein [Alistipes sp.]